MPFEIYSIIKDELNDIYDIRLRENYPIKVNFKSKAMYLTKKGLSKFDCESFVCDKQLIYEIINKITDNSIYAFNEQIKQGFIDAKNGIRIGIAGTCVFDSGQVITIKDITSLNIRIPHNIVGCSDNVFSLTLKDRLSNVLIISPPEYGKTTLLKDLAMKLDKYYNESILIIDERGEFSAISGENIDRIVYSNKLFAFEFGLRSLSPKIVITDELCTLNDWKCVFLASNSGVNIIASCHAYNLEELKQKEYFINAFDFYVVLKCESNKGEIDSIFNKDFKKI